MDFLYRLYCSPDLPSVYARAGLDLNGRIAACQQLVKPDKPGWGETILLNFSQRRGDTLEQITVVSRVLKRGRDLRLALLRVWSRVIDGRSPQTTGGLIEETTNIRIRRDISLAD